MLYIILLFLILFFVLVKTKYEFFNIRLEKATSFYNDYRNFIDGNDYLLLKNMNPKRLMPYKINNSCFNNNFRTCKNKLKNKCYSSKIIDKHCEQNSFNSCVIPFI